MTFQLLLAGPGAGEEVRFQPDARALSLQPHLPRAPTSKLLDVLGDAGGDPKDLRAQRWGLVLPAGQELEPVLQQLAPLLELRARQQGAAVRTYRAPTGLEGTAVHDWCDDVYEDEETDEADRPRYLLLVGDFEQVSLELQQALSLRAWVGRLSFDRVEDYGHYARKVCRWAEDPRERQAEAVFYSVRDGTEATWLGHAGLVEPSYRQFLKLQERGSLSLTGLRGPDDLGPAPTDLLDVAAVDRPTVLLSMSHGLTASPAGWESSEQQRALQGAMRFGAHQWLSGAEVEGRAFLPGGFWLYFACFGAGTPAVSQYREWFERLRGIREDAEALLRYLEGPAPRPFTAALPQRALANPHGPLGVIAHVDLTWNDSFQDTTKSFGSRASRFFVPLQLLAQGARAGIAVKQLSLAADRIDNHLWVLQRHATQAQEEERERLWMLRQDLRAFILLGDPAARLPLRSDVQAR